MNTCNKIKTKNIVCKCKQYTKQSNISPHQGAEKNRGLNGVD